MKSKFLTGMMPAKVRLAATIIALTFLGPLQMPLGAADERPTPKGMQTAFIHDPVLNKDAFGVWFPLKWHFQGTLLQGTKCSSIPFPVFRASSPDGLTVLERLPRLDWVNQNLAQVRAIYAPQYAASGLPQPTETQQMARATVRYKNGTFTVKGLLHATVDCTQTRYASLDPRVPAEVSNSCYANVRYVHAPEAQYQAAITLLDPKSTGAFDIPEWVSAWMADSNKRAQAVIKGMRDRTQAALAASAEQFQYSQDVRQQMHEEFMSTLQRGTTMSMNRAAEIANSNHTITSDWVDYSLDRQTVRDPNSGQITKVSSALTYTWLDGSGNVSYQTNDPNANPNGTLQGNWTRQQQVHGDGSNK